MKPDFAIVNSRRVDDVLVFEIDSKKATYQGERWTRLSSYERRKFENLVVLANPTERIKLLFV